MAYGFTDHSGAEIRCRFIILARKDEPTPDYAPDYAPDSQPHRQELEARGGTKLGRI